MTKPPRKPPGSKLSITAPPPTTPAGWAEAIREAYFDTLEAVIATGRRLAEAKAALDHGEFEKMIEADLPFSPGTGRKFMTIAADPRFLNRSTWNDLPSNWTTLYALAGLDNEPFYNALKTGDISADMTVADVGRIKLASHAAAAKTEAAGFPTQTIADLEALAAAVDAGTVKPFKVVYADPPWKFETWSGKGGGRSPEAHYETMTVEEICAMGGLVRALAADDAVLFLWGVNWSFEVCEVETPFGEFPSMRVPSAAIVMNAWGFDHVTKAFNWVKRNPGGGGPMVDGTGADAGFLKDAKISQGKWTRTGPEDCWLGTRGAPKVLSHSVDQLVVADFAGHSVKPGIVHGYIEALVRGPYLELFARREHPSWTCWGDELAKPGADADVPAPVALRQQESKPGEPGEADVGDEDPTNLPPALARDKDNRAPFMSGAEVKP